MLDIRVDTTGIEGVLIITPDCFEDDRGFFLETYNRAKWLRHGLDLTFLQENHSRSRRNVVRGLHFQDASAPQTRVVRCTQGEVFDVAVDLRVGSPTFGHWHGETLSATNRKQLLIPPEFAHGFAVLSDVAEVQYKVSGIHVPSAERTLKWNDAEVGIRWPVTTPVLSERDNTQGSALHDFLTKPCFHYRPGQRA